MTPCEKLGYKVGDKFKICEIATTNFSLELPKDRIITLINDDRTSQPEFSGFIDNGSGYGNMQYVKLSDVEKIVETKTEEPLPNLVDVFKKFASDLGSGYDTALFLTKDGHLVKYGLDFDCYEWKGTEAEIIDKINLLRQLHITN